MGCVGFLYRFLRIEACRGLLFLKKKEAKRLLTVLVVSVVRGI